MVVVAQLVRALVCGTKGRRFESGLPPIKKAFQFLKGFFSIIQLTSEMLVLFILNSFVSVC